MICILGILGIWGIWGIWGYEIMCLIEEDKNIIKKNDYLKYYNIFKKFKNLKI